MYSGTKYLGCFVSHHADYLYDIIFSTHNDNVEWNDFWPCSVFHLNNKVANVILMSPIPIGWMRGVVIVFYAGQAKLWILIALARSTPYCTREHAKVYFVNLLTWTSDKLTICRIKLSYSISLYTPLCIWPGWYQNLYSDKIRHKIDGTVHVIVVLWVSRCMGITPHKGTTHTA